MRKIIAFLLCFCLIFSFPFSFSATAAVVEKGIITIGTVTGNPGDNVTVPISIAENPAIMAVTISINYDASVLEYVRFRKGPVLFDYEIGVHPQRNLIRFVSANSFDCRSNGKLISLEFKIKEDATWDLSPITITYSQGDFCDWALNRIMPEIVSGGVDVQYNGSNCAHKNYGEWETVADPLCETKGLKQRNCLKCGHVDSAEVDAIGHEYSDDWTVTKPATETTNGEMARFCKRCDKTVDRIFFSLEKKEELKIENEIWETVPTNQTIEEVFKQQNPEKELTPSKPQEDSSEKIESIIENILPTPTPESDEEVMSVIEKISESFPSIYKFLDIFKILLVVLLFVL